ncbi:hypothetical protein [Cerasicoccus maritimus]|uniref:hypothetical protein n=1 Tax=Cerasicoccus maritimus TaxID=490089 RepID=UPI00285268C4|nr:hypothetical protein [Cerasicoccus maritimus]
MIIKVGMWSFLMACLCFLSAHAVQTSEPVGAIVKHIPTQTSILSFAFLKPDLYVGQAATITEDTTSGSSTITFADASWTAGRFNKATHYKFYAEAQGGGQFAGIGFDIISSDTNSITVNALATTDFSVTSGDTIIIRRHHTIKDFWNGCPSSVRNAQSFFILVFEKSGNNWLNWSNGSWSATPASDLDSPIYPGQAFYISSSSAFDWHQVGNVRTRPIQFEFYDQMYTPWIGTVYPIGVSLDDANVLSLLAVPFVDTFKLYDHATLSWGEPYVNADGFLTQDVDNLTDDGQDIFPPAVGGNVMIDMPVYHQIPAFYQSPF